VAHIGGDGADRFDLAEHQGPMAEDAQIDWIAL
jgi:hypothetical protein